ncbi:MAG: S41 family peptidase [Herpetosiphonaceae bacterium]|nr:S41 family peptidase [Herpetosiphonaceae bacterium]
MVRKEPSLVRSSRAFWWGALTAILVGIVAFMSGVSVALYWGADLPFSRVLGPTGAVRRSTPDNVSKDFEIYWQAWDLVDQHFYRDKPLDYHKMMYASLSAMMHSLGDDYTFFQEPEEATKTREQMDGQFEGIGAYLEFHNGQLVITAPVEGSPAEKAGLQAGDIVLKINDAEVAPKLVNLDADGMAKQAAALIRGPRGTPIKLLISRPATKQTLEFNLVREAIPLITIHSKMLQGNIAYIQLTQFEGTTTAQLDKALKQLLPQHPHGIILDLRNDPGGLLDTAQNVLGRFLKDGTALYEQFGDGAETRFEVQRSMGAPSTFDIPMIVLINSNSASASEIVAGALRDRGRATLLGEKSFGKGSVQTVSKLDDDSSARITIAHWLTPNKDQIHKKGIPPTWYVPFDNAERYQVPLPKVKATDPDKTSDSQLSWALKLLTTGEQPPHIPLPVLGQATAAKP